VGVASPAKGCRITARSRDGQRVPHVRPGADRVGVAVAPEHTTPLPESRAALAQARRLLDQLPDKEDSLEEYRDLIPYALDRLDNVWRTINEESEGQRTQQFAAWWAEQRTRTRDSVKVLRNYELKRNVQLTRKRSRFKFPGTMQIHKDRTITYHHEDGSEVEGIPTFIHTESRWDFNVPGLEDRPVQEVLETVYTVLAERVLPTAERLLKPE
jgi:hypothetical protein